MHVEAGSNPVGSNFHHQDTLNSTKKAEDVSFGCPLLFVPGISRVATKASPRFGTLSHHSFFSRHNPHPHRVTHIEGLNGNPVCYVNDDWYVSTPLSPHSFIRSQISWSPFGTPAIQIPWMNYGGSNSACRTAETWREELKDLAAKVTMTVSANKDKKTLAVDEPVRRRTQYSAQTGRIIPPSSQASGRRTPRRPRDLTYAPTFHDQELKVLELLCQILQTDSLSQVQQWLLYAGQREKDTVMNLIQKALDVGALNNQDQALNERGTPHPPLSQPSRASSTGSLQRNSSLSNSQQMQDEVIAEESAERIGTAEVLRIHSSEAQSHSENSIAGSTSDDNQL